MRCALTGRYRQVSEDRKSADQSPSVRTHFYSLISGVLSYRLHVRIRRALRDCSSPHQPSFYQREHTPRAGGGSADICGAPNLRRPPPPALTPLRVPLGRVLGVRGGGGKEAMASGLWELTGAARGPYHSNTAGSSNGKKAPWDPGEPTQAAAGRAAEGKVSQKVSLE